jgi:hypothetical protein
MVQFICTKKRGQGEGSKSDCRTWIIVPGAWLVPGTRVLALVLVLQYAYVEILRALSFLRLFFLLSVSGC